MNFSSFGHNNCPLQRYQQLMGLFDDHVTSVKNSYIIGKYVETIYGTSQSGQRFAVLITSGLWYAIRVIMDEDHRDKKTTFNLKLSPQADWIIRSEHLTLSGAREKANEWKSMLEQGKFLEIHNNKTAWGPNDKRPSMKIMPKDCAKNPDKYLKPGDLIQTDFYIAANHEGIYIGNGEVIHMSGHGDPKNEAKVQIGQLCPNFVANDTDTIRIKVFRIRFRSAEDIVSKAREYARGDFRCGEYNLLVKNCQHFATLCALGTEHCGDFKTMITAFVNGALLVLATIL